MLELMNQGIDQAVFLDSLLAVCLAQQRQDCPRAVHWSRHLLACIARVTGAKGLIGCRAVTFHPHYWWFSSPEENYSPKENLSDVEYFLNSHNEKEHFYFLPLAAKLCT